MGYRSQVRCLIYGEPDMICALVAKHVLTNGSLPCGDDVKRYKVMRTAGDGDAMFAMRQADPEATGWITRDYEAEVLDLTGDDWKWYTSYPEVAAWTALMAEAAGMDLNVEFVRMGEEQSDTEIEINVQDDGDSYLGVSRSIYCDIEIPEPTEGETA